VPQLTLAAFPSPATLGDAGYAATSAAHCRALEDGCILYVERTPLDWTPQALAVLRGHDDTAGSHKNIAYRCADDQLVGVRRGGTDVDALRSLLRTYAQRMTELLARLLLPYATDWRVDLTSFRPREEAGRRLPRRARNDLLHIDAFPARPTNGDRILRVFTNVHPTRPRCWMTTDTFDTLLPRFVDRPGNSLALPHQHSPWHWIRRRLLRHAPSGFAPLLRRSPYDGFMLRFHDRLKADAHFQATTPVATWEFPPGSSWIAFTDFVPHAARAGQFALEQTFFVPRTSLLQPEKAPISILERRCGAPLADPIQREAANDRPAAAVRG